VALVGRVYGCKSAGYLLSFQLNALPIRRRTDGRSLAQLTHGRHV